MRHGKEFLETGGERIGQLHAMPAHGDAPHRAAPDGDGRTDEHAAVRTVHASIPAMTDKLYLRYALR